MSTKTIEPVPGAMIQTVTDTAEYLIQTHEELINYVMKKIRHNAAWVYNFEIEEVNILNFAYTKGAVFGMPGYTFQRFAL